MWPRCKGRAWTPVPIPYDSSQLREQESYCGGHSILRPLVEIAHLFLDCLRCDCLRGARHLEFLRRRVPCRHRFFKTHCLWGETLSPAVLTRYEPSRRLLDRALRRVDMASFSSAPG